MDFKLLNRFQQFCIFELQSVWFQQRTIICSCKLLVIFYSKTKSANMNKEMIDVRAGAVESCGHALYSWICHDSRLTL